MDLRTVSCSINELERSLQCQRNDVTNKKQMLIKMKDDFQKHFQCLIDLVETDYQQLASNGDSACSNSILMRQIEKNVERFDKLKLVIENFYPLDYPAKNNEEFSIKQNSVIRTGDTKSGGSCEKCDLSSPKRETENESSRLVDLPSLSPCKSQLNSLFD